MAQQRRGYAPSATTRLAQNLGSGRASERTRETNYQDERAKFGGIFMNPGSDTDPSPEPALPPPRRSRPPPFLFHFDVDDSDSGSESAEEHEAVSKLRSAYSEPALSAPQPPDHQDRRPQRQNNHHHQQQHHQRRSQYDHTSALDTKEREALLDRVRRLSASEAETAAALARATAENAVLAEEASHWRAVAKEAASSRRAAREALSEVSAENARLAAAYSAQRLEAAALEEALMHERSQAEIRVIQLEQALRAAEARIAEMGKGKGATNSNQTASPEDSKTPQQASAAAAAAAADIPHPPANGNAESSTQHSGAWDQERQDLLGLLERLQEQLAAHAAQQERQHEQQQQQRRTPSNRRHQTPPSVPPQAAEEESTPQRSRGTPVSTSRFEFNAGADQTPNRATFATWQQSPSARSGISTPVHTNFKMPAGVAGSASKHEHGLPSASKTPATAEPLGVRCESSYESTTNGESGKSPAGAGAGHRQKETPKSAQATPVASTPPLSATRPSSGDRPAAATPQPPPVQPPAPVEEPSAKKSVAELKAAGDKLVHQKRYEAALEQYSSALTDAEAVQDSSAIVALLCSRAFALTALGRFLESAADCCRAEKVAARRGCARAIDLRAEAFSLMGAYDLAAEDLMWLRKVSEANSNGGPTPALAARLQDARRAATEGAPRNHYAVLGVKSSATAAEIKSSYKGMALRLHPDKAADTLGPESATTLFSLLSAAHATLGNAQSRRTYDLQMLRQKYANAENGGGRQRGQGSPGAQWGWR